MFKREFDYDYIVFLKKIGLSHTEISKLIGCKAQSVGRIAGNVDTDVELQYTVLSKAYESSKP